MLFIIVNSIFQYINQLIMFGGRPSIVHRTLIYPSKSNTINTQNDTKYANELAKAAGHLLAASNAIKKNSKK